MPAADRDRRQGAAGLVASATATGLFLAVAVLGPSVMQPVLPGPPGHPPYSLLAHPSPVLVISLTVAGIVLGVLGLALCLRAAARGWRPRLAVVLTTGALAIAAFALLPPIGSGDHLNYAAYGRLAATGHDPYVTAARDLPADPITRAVEPPWREEPSIYGPIATVVQAAASLVGGDSVRLTVFVLSLLNAAIFAVTGLLLHRAARGDPGRRLRAALLWTANPLLLFHLVAGAHNDTLAIGFAVGALVVFGATRSPGGGPRRAAVAGVLVGVGAAVKLPAVLAGGGPGWATLPAAVRRWPLLRRIPAAEPGPRSPAALAALLVGVGTVAGLAYTLAGPHAFDQVRRASDAVSLATPWQLVRQLLDSVLGISSWRSLIQLAALALTFVLLWLLLRALPQPRTCWASWAPGDPGGDAARATAAFALAWLFSAPYALPWYDGLGWALLALLPWSRFDGLLLARTAVLSLAYLPARDPAVLAAAGMPASLDWLVTVVRAQLIPWALTGILLALVVACLSRTRPAPTPVRSPPVRAGRPR